MNGKVPTPQPAPIVLHEAKVRIVNDPIRVQGSGELAFTRAAEADPGVASLLLFDPAISAFRPVITPPGTAWELVEKRQGPRLWKPGMRT